MAFSKIAAIFFGSAVAGAGLGAFNHSKSSEVHAWSKRDETIFTPMYQPFKLGEVINLAEDVAIFRFLLPKETDEFNLPPCATLQCQLHVSNSVRRAYTPITPNHTKGYFDLLVKKQHHGRMTELMFAMKPGDSLDMRMMSHKLTYTPNTYDTVGMIGGGTGICPLIQVVHNILQNPEDTTKISMLFANRSESKILMRGMLDEMAERNPEQFRLHYTVDSTLNPEWKGYVGHINKKMIQDTMPSPTGKNLVLLCGPDPMIHALAGVPYAVLKQMSGSLPRQPVSTHMSNFQELSGLLADCGYKNEQVYRF